MKNFELSHRKTTLDSGLRVLTSNMLHTRSVSIGVFVGIGSRYETDAEAGISHFIEHLLFKGTPKRPTSMEISAAIEGVGGTFNGGTDKELTLYWCKVARPHFPIALDVLTDMILHSKFESEEIEKERHVIIDEIGLSKDSPSQRADMLIDEVLWPGHPLGRDIAGSAESVEGITRQMMLDYLSSRYRPDNTVIAIAGDIEHDETLNAVSRATEDWAASPSRQQYLPYREQPAPRVRIEPRDTEQTHLCLGLPGISLFHPGRFAIDLLNVILGEGMSSRLFTEIRDKLGLAYSVHSYVEHFLDSGSLTVFAGVEPKNLKASVQAILEQLSRIRETVPESELSRAREMSKGRLLLRMEDSRSVAGWLGGQETLTGQVLSVDEIISIVDAVTADEISRIAQELITDRSLRMAIVGPHPADEPLEELLKL